MIEVWKDIDGFEGLYQVSNYGRVKSLERTVTYSSGNVHWYPERVLVPVDAGNGYLRVSLSINNKYKSHLIHRLVAKAFVENPDNLPCVNHKDENQSNNHIDNLEWCSYKYNSNYGTAVERRSNKRSRPVDCYNTEGALVKHYKKVADAIKDLKLKTGDKIRLVCNGQRKKAAGFVWRWNNV